MKINHLLLFVVLPAFMITSCGPSSTKSDVSDSSEEYVEEENEEEDKSKRPSPPRTTTANISGINVTIDYSAPAVKGRTVFGNLEPYGKVWRTGANEATVITTDGDVTLNGEVLPKGQYALFTIPGEAEWTVIFNKEPNQWGAFNYNPDLDVLKIQVTPEINDEVTERLNFTVSSEGQISFGWEKVSFIIEVGAAAGSGS